MSRCASFAKRLRSAETLIGTFQKTPHHHITELLALTKMQFVVIDGEHSSFGHHALDTCILAARAVDFPVMVRVACNEPEAILSALDLGATGIFAPHIRNQDDAARVAESAHYLSGSRGFSPSTRAGGYGTRGLTSYMQQADREVAVVLQIEDAEALAVIAAIAKTPGVSGLFVGRADLAASMNLDWEDPALDQATRAVADACLHAGIACGAYLGNESRRALFAGWGVTFFVVGSDQGSLRAEADRIAGAFIDSSL